MRRIKLTIIISIFLFSAGLFFLTEKAEAPQDSFWAKVNTHIPPSSGLQVRRLYDEVAEITGPDGFVHRVNLADAGQWAATLRAAGDTAKKTIEIHIPDLDTTGFAQRFRLVTTVPVGRANSSVIHADTDQDGLAEVVGFIDNFEFRSPAPVIYERVSADVDSFHLVFDGYPEGVGVMLVAGDINTNELLELSFDYGVFDSVGNFIAEDVIFFESPEAGELATQKILQHRMSGNISTGVQQPRIADLDRDGNMDFLHKGSNQEGVWPYISEYQPQADSLKRVWTTDIQDLSGDWAIGDFDADGKMEFANGGSRGEVYVFEHTGQDDDYAVSFEDLVPTFNVGFHTEGEDTDGDGRDELFIGGASFVEGIWTNVITCFETVGDNQYEKSLEIRITGMGSIAVLEFFDQADVDGDGKKELVLSAGGSVLILKNVGDDTFEPFWFIHYPSGTLGVHFTKGNVASETREDILISYPVYNETDDRDKLLTDIFTYHNDRPNSVEDIPSVPTDFILFQNYPNPFNAGTTIRWQLPQKETVTLTIYNLLGEEVIKLVDNQETREGVHSISWDAKNVKGGDVASGVYVVQLRAGISVQSRKLVVMK